MDRLFVFGDSWSFNYFSKEQIHRPELKSHLNSNHVAAFVEEYDYYGHWTDYLGDVYDVYNYSEGGCCNEDIIHQLSYLPEYREGDRIIITLTSPSRFQWMVGDKRKTLINGNYWKSKLSNVEREIYDTQFIARTDLWNESAERDNEKNFIKKIPLFFKEYNPVLTTWNTDILQTIDGVIEIGSGMEYTSIYTESSGKYDDGHLGVYGNLLLYKFLAKHLGVIVDSNTEKNIIKKIKQMI